MDSPKKESTLVIGALSRPLHLGRLYNALTDNLIPGVSLWKMEDIKRHTHVTRQPNTRYQVAASESLSDKTKLLDVSASVKLSFFGGLIEAGGSAKYLNDKTSSTRQCRVSLSYHETAEVRELMTSELGAPDPAVLSKTDATHVVTQVLYGADALMEFEQTASDQSSKQDIQGSLHLMINKIPGISISGDGSLNMKDEDKEKVKNFRCKFYGDFSLKELPTTFEEAVMVYKQLPTLLGENREKAVPVKVWLYPLSKLTDNESKLKAMISQKEVFIVEKVMDDFHHAEIKTSDLLVMSKKIKADDITTKLKQFQNSLRVFTVEFLKEMRALIPAIRGGTIKETKLVELLNTLTASGFSGPEMGQWLDGKETEINVITLYINQLKYDIKTSGSELDSYLLNPSVTDVFVFSFSSLKYEEPYLNKISETAKTFKSGSAISIQSPPEEGPWYRKPEVKKAMDSALSIFNKITHKNKVISLIPDPNHLGASIRWYHNAVLKDPHVTTNPLPSPELAFTAVLQPSSWDGQGYGRIGPFGSEKTLIHGKVLTNLGGAYDSTTGVFTAPVKGVYFFTFTSYSWVREEDIGVKMMKNNEEVLLVAEWQDAGDNEDYASNSVLLELDVGDRVYISLPKGFQVAANSWSNIHTFSGFLLYPDKEKHSGVAFTAALQPSSAKEGGYGTIGPFDTGKTLIHGKLLTNVGHGYNSNTGVFTAPVKGVYFFTFTTYSWVRAEDIGVKLVKNNVEVLMIAEWQDKGDNEDYASNSVVLKLEVGDKVYINLPKGFQVAANKWSNIHTFSGFLLYPSHTTGKEVAFTAALQPSSWDNDGYGTIGPFDSEITLVHGKILTNVGSSYNSNTGVFTAPVKGLYFFTFTTYGWVREEDIGVKLMKNNVEVLMIAEWQDKGDNEDYASNSVFLELKVGDRVYMSLPKGFQVAANRWSNIHTFSGFLIYENKT